MKITPVHIKKLSIIDMNRKKAVKCYHVCRSLFLVDFGGFVKLADI